MLGDEAGCHMLIMAPDQASAGLTLIELLIVLALSAIVLAIGAPVMGRWVRDIEVRSNATVLLSALHAARSEALLRNTSVTLDLPDTEGRPGWQLACARVTSRCPGQIRRKLVDTGTAVRWGAAKFGSMPSFNTALGAGREMPASIQFDHSGAVPAIASGVGIARLDVTHQQDAEAHRMVVLISAQGMVRVCDPSASAGHPQHCH